jgi:membrane-associated phospholipid phosphatase
MFQLPTLAHRDNQFRIAIIVGFIAMMFYGISGRLALMRDSIGLDMSPIDEAIPLLPWTFWVYGSVYFIFFASCWLQRDLKVYNRFLYTYLVAYFLISVFFLLYPTEFPRADFPVNSSTASGAALTFFRQIDLPNNCFPSMHVGTCVLVTLPFYRRRPKVFLLFALWTMAIAITTLTTKQHYLIDVIAGFVYAFVMYGSSVLLISTDEPSASPPSLAY